VAGRSLRLLIFTRVRCFEQQVTHHGFFLSKFRNLGILARTPPVSSAVAFWAQVSAPLLVISAVTSVLPVFGSNPSTRLIGADST
jgi:hypothetical protein